jgi:lysophospholipase L1-like esterase
MKNGLLVVAGIVLALLIVEIFLRLTGIGTVRPQTDFDQNTRTIVQAGHLVPDHALLWRESGTTPSEAEAHIKLIRVGEPAPPKSGKFRIICLGDSCTRLSMGGMPYSALLEAQLAADGVEVFNASLPGYTSHQCLAWLRLQLLDYLPDLVVVYVGWNDHWRTTGWTDRELAARFSRWRPRLLNLVQRRREPPPLRVPLPEFAENLRAMAELVADRGGKTLFVTPPMHMTEEAVARHVEAGYLLAGDDLAAIHRRYQAAVRQLASAPGARVFDAAQLFELTQEPELLWSDGIHPTDLGHLVLAATLADKIAVEHLEAPAVPSTPSAVALAVIAQNLAGAGRWAEALQRSRRAVEAAPQDQDVLLGHTWLLATCPIDSLRNPVQALARLDAYAGPAARSYRFHDVRGAALAAAGRYPEAIAAAREALSVLASADEQPHGADTHIRDRLALYESGQPFLLRSRAR